MDFYRLTMVEYHYVAKGFLLRDEREWQRTRWLAALLVNIQLPKNSKVDPEDLIKLPSDSLIKVKKPTPTKAEFDAAVARYRKELKS